MDAISGNAVRGSAVRYDPFGPFGPISPHGAGLAVVSAVHPEQAHREYSLNSSPMIDGA